MKTRVAPVVAAVAALAATSFIYAQAPEPSFAERVATLRTTSNVPAVGGVTFTSSSIGAVAVSGVRKLGDPAEVAVGDQWHIGSLTKSFTSAMIAKRVERGELKWDATLRELLEPGRALRFAGATLTNVLSHRAGLPPNPVGAGNAIYQSADPMPVIRRKVVDLALATEPTYPVGGGYQYSNVDYILLGSILESKTGKSWEELVKAEILTPMKLTSAGFGAPGTAGATTQPRGHRANGASLIPIEPGPFADNPPVFGPAGTLHMSIADLARWGQEHLRGERGQDGMLKAETFKFLHTPPVTPGDYALGWVSQTKNGQRVIWHNGSNTMWYAILAFNPATDKGVVLVTNGSINARAGLDALAFELLTTGSDR
jgi:CubicO group peptidase (beta-lactamase class C family)